MTTYSTAFPATIILSLLSSIVQGQDYSNRGEKLLHTPEHFQCDSDGFHADPNDCSIFFRCIDWGESSENSLQPRYTSFKFQCGEGTVFDIESNNCVHIEETTRSECRHYVEPYMFARRDSGDPEQVDYGVVQPSSEYNRPSQQPSYNRPTTDGQMPGDSGEVDNNIGEPSSPPPSKSPPCEADGFFPIPNDCEHFYRCVSNGNGFLKYEFSCGPGTVWDPDSNACNHRWAVSRSDCRSEGGSETGEGPEGGPETGEGPESPEIEQVAEPSSSTAAPSTTTMITSSTTTTTRPYQPSSSSTSRPSSSTAKPTTTTTKRSTTSSASKPTTTSSTTDASPSSTTPSDVSSGNSTKPNEGSSGNSTKPGNSCDSEGFFPDEKDCRKFYRCANQEGKFAKYEFECAEGTVWDIQETTCNYPYAVQRSNCNSTNSESQTSSTSDEASSSTSTTSASSSSQATSSTSSSSTSSTSSYANSTSSSTSQQSSSSQTTSSSSQATSSQNSNSNSTTSSQSTSSSQQTTSSQQSTTSANNTSSQNGTTPVTTESSTSSNNGSQSKGDSCMEEGFFPSSKNCNKFYRCVRNEGSGFSRYEFNCGPGTVWDPANNVCNHPWAVQDEKCRSDGQGTTPIGESQTSESTTSSSSTEGSSPSSTPTGESQTSELTTSSSSTEVSSPSSGSNTTTTTAPSTTAVQTSTTNSNATTTVSANNTDSTESSGTTLSNSTATTTESSSISTTAESNATTTQAGCTNSTTNKPPSKIKCDKAGYYPNPDDCKKFYRCVDWDGDKGERFSVYHFNCPEGTIFDPSLNVCNHAESVYPPRNCDGSSGSQTTDSTTTSSPGSDNTTTTESTTDSTTNNTTDVTETSSEPTTLQPTTDSTNTTETTTTGSETTPQTTPAVTTPSEQTTIGASTSEKGTEGTTPATTGGASTEPTTPYTTPSSQITTTQTTTTEMLTTTSPSSETCPELEPDQFSLVCPTGFRRHPKYCNLFYQCTVSKSMDIKIVTLSCANGTVYDEKKIQCLPPDEAKKCEGSMMTDARNLKNLGDNSISPIPVKSDKSICPAEGSFSYKDDCRLFYKCKKDDQGKLTGYLYQCPEGFAYWSVSKRCEKTEKVPCENKKTSSTTWKSTLAPVESKNVGF